MLKNQNMHTFSLKAQVVDKKFDVSTSDEEKFIEYKQIKIEFSIDNMEVISFKSNADFFSLLEPVEEGESERYLLTCTCGVPECAGYDPFVLIREGNQLRITIPNQRMYAPMNGLEYILDAKQFEAAQISLMQYISFHTSKGVYLYEPYAENEIEVLEGEQSEYVLSEAKHIDFIENFKVFNELVSSPAVVFF